MSFMFKHFTSILQVKILPGALRMEQGQMWQI